MCVHQSQRPACSWPHPCVCVCVCVRVCVRACVCVCVLPGCAWPKATHHPIGHIRVRARARFGFPLHKVVSTVGVGVLGCNSTRLVQHLGPHPHTLCPHTPHPTPPPWSLRACSQNVMRCHVHTVTTGQGTKIGTRMKEVQTAYQKLAEATLGDPFFAAKNAPRQVPEGRLFNMQIHRGDLKALEVIGAGQFGAVYLATQRMLCCPNFGCDVKKAIDGHLKRHMAVCEYASDDGGDEKPKVETEIVTRACKMLKGAATPSARKEFFDEANVMLMFDHPNVTNIMGVAVQQAPWLYVLEYCMYGDLRGVLKGYQQKRLMLTVGEILHMCKSVVLGMEHIVSHRLKPHGPRGAQLPARREEHCQGRRLWSDARAQAGPGVLRRDGQAHQARSQVDGARGAGEAQV